MKGTKTNVKTLSTQQESEFNRMTNKILSKLKPKTKLQKVEGTIIKYFIENCTIEVQILVSRVSKYLYELDKRKYLKSVVINNKTYLKALILSNSGKHDFKLKRFPITITKPSLYRLGNKAYLYVVPYDDTCRAKVRMYFTGKKVLPFVVDFINYLNRMTEGVNLYTYDSNKKKFISISNNPRFCIENFIISGEKREKIVDYLDKSIKFQKMMFDKYGVIKNPGILLYGFPGTGKSMLVKVISHIFDADIYMIDVGNIVEELNALIDEFDTNPDTITKLTIVCFEDIDVVYTSRENLETDEKNSFNTLLQFLDGYKSLPGMIKIATTNHIERLDEALIRAGRFDLQIQMKNFDQTLAKEMCERYSINSDDVISDVETAYNPAELHAAIIEKLNFKIINNR